MTTPGKSWFTKLRGICKGLELLALRAAQCLFILRSGDNMMILLVHVDDLPGTGNNILMMYDVFNRFKDVLTLKGPDKMISFTGCNVVESGNYLYIEGRAFILDMLVENGYGDKATGTLHVNKAVKSPMIPEELDVYSPLIVNVTAVQGQLGKLIWTMTMYWDVLKPSVTRAARTGHYPTEQTARWIDRIFRFCIHIIDYALCVKRDNKYLVNCVAASV